MDKNQFLGLFLVATGILGMAWGIIAWTRARGKARAAENWSTTVGKVLAAEVRMEQGESDGTYYVITCPRSATAILRAGARQRGRVFDLEWSHLAPKRALSRSSTRFALVAQWLSAMIRRTSRRACCKKQSSALCLLSCPFFVWA